MKHYFLISNFSLQFYTRIKKRIKKHFLFKIKGKKTTKILSTFKLNSETYDFINNMSITINADKQYSFDKLLQIVGKTIKLKSETFIKNNVKTNLFFNY